MSTATLVGVSEGLILKEDISQKSEDNLAMAESELDKNSGLVSELTRRVEELQGLADEAARLKDQLDESVFMRPIANFSNDSHLQV